MRVNYLIILFISLICFSCKKDASRPCSSPPPSLQISYNDERNDILLDEKKGKTTLQYLDTLVVYYFEKNVRKKVKPNFFIQNDKNGKERLIIESEKIGGLPTIQIYTFYFYFSAARIDTISFWVQEKTENNCGFYVQYNAKCNGVPMLYDEKIGTHFIE